MTINREAAELMAARLTSAVDVVDTFKEALRLATVALQEPREVSEVEPGTAGTATVRGVEGVRGTWVNFGAEGLYFAHHDIESTGDLSSPAALVTDFVPDLDTATLRAEVDRLNGELESERHAVETQSGLYQGLAKWAKEQRDRADAAEARLARVTALLDAPGEDVSCAGRNLTEPGCFAHDLATRIRAVVAADEQAAEAVRRPHDPSCNLMTSPCADCLQQASRG